jgi:hypothetical protein
MRKHLFLILGIASFFSPIQPLLAQEAVPDEFLSVAVDAPNSYEFAKECIPSMSETSFNQSVRDAADKKTVVTWPSDKTKPFLGVAKGRAYCVKMSAQRNPVLPLSVFDETISFADMSKDEIRRYRTDLSKQLSTVGIATALVVNDKGNAYQVAYLFSSDTPNKFYYHAGFLKKGEFDETSFRSVYRATGGMSVTGRGQLDERYKPFFW